MLQGLLQVDPESSKLAVDLKLSRSMGLDSDEGRLYYIFVYYQILFVNVLPHALPPMHAVTRGNFETSISTRYG